MTHLEVPGVRRVGDLVVKMFGRSATRVWASNRFKWGCAFGARWSSGVEVMEGSMEVVRFKGGKLEGLGVESVEWCKQWVKNGSQAQLDLNLDVLSKWGMSVEGRKRVVRGTPVIVDCVPDEIERKLEWLVEVGLERKDVVRVVETHPRILQSSIQGSLMPFVKLFVEGGCSKDGIKRMIMRQPRVLGRTKRFESALASILAWVKLSRGEFMKVVMRYPHILGVAKERRVVSMIENLLALQISKEEVAQIFMTAPELFVKAFEDVMKPKLEWLQGGLGISVEEAVEMLVRDPKAFVFSLSRWEENHSFWSAQRFSETEIAKAFLKSPFLLSKGTKDVSEKFEFAKHVLRKGHHEIIQCPDYFTHAYADRTLLRVAFLDCKGEDFSKWSLRSISSGKSFETRYGKQEFRDFANRWGKLDRDTKLKVVSLDARFRSGDSSVGQY